MSKNNKSHDIDFSLSWLFAETDFLISLQLILFLLY